MRLKLTLEYDGVGFHGWAAQPGLRTIEGEVRAALDRVFPSWSELGVAGRTDTGVHATGQVVSVEVDRGPPPERAAGALNAELPDDVAVLSAEAAPPDFHARHSAVARPSWVASTHGENEPVHCSKISIRCTATRPGPGGGRCRSKLWCRREPWG